MKPIEEDKIMAELLKAKVKTISKPIRDKDYQIEKVIRKKWYRADQHFNKRKTFKGIFRNSPYQKYDYRMVFTPSYN